ncbi:MAG: peptidylprolyl isomerase [Chloroflexaceae bacterium]|nr:peptidylprolyl isomerase [Chloroflexaceae bacterium]
MTEILKVGTRSVASPHAVIRLLAEYQPSPLLLQSAIVDLAIANISCSPEEEMACLQGFYQQQGLQTSESQENWLRQHHLTVGQLTPIVTRTLRIEKYKQATWGHHLEDYFLINKSKLDRVIYRAIYTEDRDAIQELYFRLIAGEDNFANLASQYSQGPGREREARSAPLS